jgi:hypothetical protein
MYSTVLADATFHQLLLAFDQDIANTARQEQRALCTGVLHSGRYRRKPCGRPAGLGEEHDWRFSFCCARDGCRTRKTPPSIRFLGRKVYVAAAVVDATAPGPSSYRWLKLPHDLTINSTDRRSSLPLPARSTTLRKR